MRQGIDALPSVHAYWSASMLTERADDVGGLCWRLFDPTVARLHAAKDASTLC